MIDIRPSILAADMLNLERDIQRVEKAVKWLHFDVMDAHFVPNLSFGPSLCNAVKKRFPDLLLDVHLMMTNPKEYISVFKNAGADAITFHLEAEDDPVSTVNLIHSCGALAGISVKPGTPVEKLYPFVDKADLILIMTVEPGFGGQKFMPEMLEKIRKLREYGFGKAISVDGGVGSGNLDSLLAAGADTFVMGTSVFKSDDPELTIRMLGGV